MNKAVLVGATATTASEYSGVKKKAQRAAEFLNRWTYFFFTYCLYLHTVHWFLGWIRLRYLCWCRNPAEQCAVASLEHTQEVVNFGLCSGNLGQKEGHFLYLCLLKWDCTYMYTKSKYSPLMLDLYDHSNSGVNLAVWTGMEPGGAMSKSKSFNEDLYCHFRHYRIIGEAPNKAVTHF